MCSSDLDSELQDLFTIDELPSENPAHGAVGLLASSVDLSAVLIALCVKVNRGWMNRPSPCKQDGVSM